MSHDWDKGRYAYCGTCRREYDTEHRGHDCPGTALEQVRRLVQESDANTVIVLVRQVEVEETTARKIRDEAARQLEIDQLKIKIHEGDEARRRLEELKK